MPTRIKLAEPTRFLQAPGSSEVGGGIKLKTWHWFRVRILKSGVPRAPPLYCRARQPLFLHPSIIQENSNVGKRVLGRGTKETIPMGDRSEALECDHKRRETDICLCHWRSRGNPNKWQHVSHVGGLGSNIKSHGERDRRMSHSQFRPPEGSEARADGPCRGTLVN